MVVIKDRTNRHPTISLEPQFENKSGGGIFIDESYIRTPASDNFAIIRKEIWVNALKRGMAKAHAIDIPLRCVWVRVEDEQKWYQGKIRRSARRLLR